MKTMQELRTLLTSIDHKSYPAYKALQGAYRYSDFVLSIDHVQGDPFAAPSCVSVLVPMKAAGFPADFLSPSYKRIALQDHLLRLFSKKLDSYAFRAKGSGKSGLLSCSRCGQQILERTSCTITGEGVQLRFEIGFPANGRTINAAELAKILFDFLPVCVHTTLLYGQLDAKAVADVLSLAEDQAYIRHELNRQGLVA
ncbi:MAG: ABC-ATPase domain-containing protein, partial [Clostridia bacterium]